MQNTIENVEELNYLSVLKQIIEHGDDISNDRTGVGTFSIFGSVNLEFDLGNGSFPLMTTKKMFWKGVVEELLWMMRGCTDSRHLESKKVNIWKPNASRSFLDSRGLTGNNEGDLGPVYGFQWRHFNAEYKNSESDYSNQGIDQLANVIDQIKHDPKSRRIVMSAWNPSDLDKMALPPCHVLCQFHVGSDSSLSCKMYQRSADMGLGAPFNIASYSLLTCIIADYCNLKRGQFYYSIGDAHVYKNHVNALIEQASKTPFPFPQLNIRKSLSEYASIDDLLNELTFNDFDIVGYQSHETIKMNMAV